MRLAFPILVGDIGGTNARFRILSDRHAEPLAFDPVRIAAHESLEAAIENTVLANTSLRPASMMLAIATPLIGERFRLTNADWIFDPPAIVDAFSLTSLVIMNDFAAQGLAALALQPDELHAIGTALPEKLHPRVVIGPGTGLGIALLAQYGGRWAVIPGEGGHVDLGPRTQREFQIWPHLAKAGDRISAELAVSGRGLENLYRAIRIADGHAPIRLDAAEISRHAVEATDPHAVEAVELFLTLLARICGDLALISLARGGVYIAGGITVKLLPTLDARRFRSAFENKEPHTAILQSVPVSVITHPFAALEGMAACAANPQGFWLESMARLYGRDFSTDR